MKKSAAIYKRYNKGYLIYSWVKAVSGLHIAAEPYIIIHEGGAYEDKIAGAIKAALCLDMGTEKRTPDPKDWKEFNKDFFRKAGLKTMKELNQLTNKYVSVDENDSELIFKPSKHAEKLSHGYLPKDKTETVTIPNNASNYDIVMALELALSKCN